MAAKSQNKTFLGEMSSYTNLVGILFVVLGLLAVIYPYMGSVTTALYIGWLMLFGGVAVGYFTWTNDKKEWVGWLKSFILLLTGIFTLMHPLAGVGALGLILAIYFFMDAFNSLTLAFDGAAGNRFLWFLNAFLSSVLGVIMIAYWPNDSLYMVGLVVGLSLLFDGIVLLIGGSKIKDIDKTIKKQTK